MDEYLRRWLPTAATDLADAINDEETKGALFVANFVLPFEGTPTNLTLFRELSPGERVDAAIHVATHDAPAPRGARLLWSGPALLGGSSRAVSVFREEARP